MLPGSQTPTRLLFSNFDRAGFEGRRSVRKYVVDGKMTEGFAFVAFPADYRNSDVKTFIVNKNGVVYQKDLGPQTMNIANSMTAYNPDSSLANAE
jgi:hypothetical protein